MVGTVEHFPTPNDEEGPYLDKNEVLNLEELFFEEKVRPVIILMAAGIKMEFLCDSGACKTTVKTLPPGTALSNESSIVRAAQGSLRHVPITEPVRLRDPEGVKCDLSLLFLPECPVNLLGRDGLTALQLALIPTPNGIQIKRMCTEVKDTCVLRGVGLPHYYYSVDIPNKAPTKTGQYLIDRAVATATQAEDVMSPDDLHVTMWFTDHVDPQYKIKLDRVTPAKVTLTHLFITNTTVVAVAALPEELKKLYRGWNTPHVSLCKGKKQQWKDLGLIVARGLAATDWKCNPQGDCYSPSTGLTRQPLFVTTMVQAGAHMQSKSP